MIFAEYPSATTIEAKWSLRIDGKDCYLRERITCFTDYEMGPMPPEMVEPLLRERQAWFEAQMARVRVEAMDRLELLRSQGKASGPGLRLQGNAMSLTGSEIFALNARRDGWLDHGKGVAVRDNPRKGLWTEHDWVAGWEMAARGEKQP